MIPTRQFDEADVAGYRAACAEQWASISEVERRELMAAAGAACERTGWHQGAAILYRHDEHFQAITATRKGT